MYKLIRRISSSFFPRPDRPWSEDATSTAPQIGRKRRFSSTEPDDDGPSASAPKRHRLDTIEPEGASRREEGEGVKEVTKGVQEVEIEEGKVTADTQQDTPAVTLAAAAIPLPDSPVLEAQQTQPESIDSETKATLGEALTEESVAKMDDSQHDVPPEKVMVEPVLVNGLHTEGESEESASATSTTETIPFSVATSDEVTATLEKKGDAAATPTIEADEGLLLKQASEDNIQDH